MSVDPASSGQPAHRRVVVWDLPTRLFHWLLAGCFLFEWITQDDSRYLDYHVFVGYAMGALVLFRIVWGFVGTRWARFRSFAYGPREALRYLIDVVRRRQSHYVGHNPAGSWAIYFLLTLVLLSVLSGIALLGAGKQQGPMAGLLSFAQGGSMHQAHELLAWAALLVVAVHILGVIVSSIADRENLAWGMMRGAKYTRGGEAAVARSGRVAASMLVVLAAAAVWYFAGYFTATPEHPYLPFRGPELAQDARWHDECSDCHLDYHPSLLPARSWQALLAQQDDHFGEALGLSDATLVQLAQFAVDNSAERGQTAAAWSVTSRLRPGETPLRITETRYWTRRHRGIADAEWALVKKIQCEGCHLDAALGTFEPGAVKIAATPPSVRKAK